MLALHCGASRGVGRSPTDMSRRFTIVSVALTAVVAFLVGAIFAGGLDHASVAAGAPPGPSRCCAPRRLRRRSALQARCR